MKQRIAGKMAGEIAAAAKRHERRYGAAVKKRQAVLAKRYAEEAEAVVSFLVRHPPMASLTQDTRDALSRRLNEHFEDAFDLCHYALPLGVECPDEFPLVAIAWRVLMLMARGDGGQGVGSKNLADHFRDHRFGPRESRALASMVGLSAINSVLQRLRSDRAALSAEIIMKALPMAFSGMAAGIAERAGKKRSKSGGGDRKRMTTVHLLLDRAFAAVCPPEIRESIAEAGCLFYEWSSDFQAKRSGGQKTDKVLKVLRERIGEWPAELQDAVAWRVKRVMDGKTV